MSSALDRRLIREFDKLVSLVQKTGNDVIKKQLLHFMRTFRDYTANVESALGTKKDYGESALFFLKNLVDQNVPGTVWINERTKN